MAFNVFVDGQTRKGLSRFPQHAVLGSRSIRPGPEMWPIGRKCVTCVTVPLLEPGYRPTRSEGAEQRLFPHAVTRTRLTGDQERASKTLIRAVMVSGAALLCARRRLG